MIPKLLQKLKTWIKLEKTLTIYRRRSEKKKPTDLEFLHNFFVYVVSLGKAKTLTGKKSWSLATGPDRLLLFLLSFSNFHFSLKKNRINEYTLGRYKCYGRAAEMEADVAICREKIVWPIVTWKLGKLAVWIFPIMSFLSKNFKF